MLLSCRALMACCCFSRAASMSPRSSSTELLLFFPAALVKASCWIQEEEEEDVITPTTHRGHARERNHQQTWRRQVHTCNFFCSMLISEYSCAVARAAARAFFLWLLALLGTEVVMGMGVCTMLIGEFSGRLSSYRYRYR